MDAKLLFGIDVSHAQGNVDFQALARSTQPGRPPFRFVILKATEGGDFEDAGFRDKWKALVELDPGRSDPWLVRGAYHFARPDNRTSMPGREAGQTEAKWFCSVLKQVGSTGAGSLPPMVDWEKWAGKADRNRDWLEGFIDVVSNELGRVPGIYTGPDVWEGTTGNWDGLVGKVALWQVKYDAGGADPSATGPKNRLIKGSAVWPWTIWQWSGGGDFDYYGKTFGAVPGVQGGIADVDRFDGTAEQLLALAMIGGASTSASTTGTSASTATTKASVGTDQGTITLPTVDLASFGTSRRVQVVAEVQGLLLAAELGPEGLVGSNGRPDGKAGSKTLAALRAFKQAQGLAVDTVVDERTWSALLRS
ncbi:GH25 family lysozyme [Paraliomyxa miuraensis]|uniref:GH25 family lysozyme n=1 Tax=Paraliomyxa miuraensis TaxID=376150 RepID=UPI0022511A93|nr:GH25 family lysozyme [Paraliomyxa miuraensis]MCX4241705.1 GH25 family lysozyme [Paraliomyxa miuraensis]